MADVVKRSAGNPFFAEESARLLTDQVRGASVPVSVQAVVAARLDGLPAEEKGILGGRRRGGGGVLGRRRCGGRPSRA